MDTLAKISPQEFLLRRPTHAGSGGNLSLPGSLVHQPKDKSRLRLSHYATSGPTYC